MKMCCTRWDPRCIFSRRRIEADFSHKEYRSANLHLTRQSRTSRTYPDLRSRQLNHHVITTSITRALKAAAKCLLPKLRPINIELCGEVTDALSVWRSVRRPQRYHSRPGSVISEVSSELATSTQLASPWHGAHRGALVAEWAVSGQGRARRRVRCGQQSYADCTVGTSLTENTTTAALLQIISSFIS